jgi:hypothetical protein
MQEFRSTRLRAQLLAFTQNYVAVGINIFILYKIQILIPFAEILFLPMHPLTYLKVQSTRFFTSGYFRQTIPLGPLIHGLKRF